MLLELLFFCIILASPGTAAARNPAMPGDAAGSEWLATVHHFWHCGWRALRASRHFQTV